MPKFTSFGFTLVELMVVIVIIAVLVIVLLPLLGQFNQTQAIANASYELETSLRATQNDATSGITCAPTLSAANWFVRFYYDSVLKIWTYKTGNDCPPALGATPTPIFTSSGHLVPQTLYISSLSADGQAMDMSNISNYYDVQFDNINGQVAFFTPSSNGSWSSVFPAASTFEIKLSLVANSGSCQIVEVQKGGSIYVQSNPVCP